jgi:hypothetical protein
MDAKEREERAKEREALLAAFDRLTEQERKSLRYALFQGYDDEEVGKRIGVSADLARTLIEQSARTVVFGAGVNVKVPSLDALKDRWLDYLRTRFAQEESFVLQPPQSEREALEVTFEFPAGTSDEEIKNAVTELVLAASRKHREAGGNGLEIRDVRIETDSRQGVMR